MRDRTIRFRAGPAERALVVLKVIHQRAVRQGDFALLAWGKLALISVSLGLPVRLLGRVVVFDAW